MKFSISVSLVLFALHTAAQFVGWRPNQRNSSICIWPLLRAAIVRDVIYLDGGELWWSTGMADGSVADGFVDGGNPQGLVLTYNLSVPYDSSTNITGVLLRDAISKTLTPQGAVNDFAPRYVEGAMLANDDEFFLYGGEVNLRDTYQPPADDSVIRYNAYKSGAGADKPLTPVGFYSSRTNNKVHRYMTSGGAVNAPSENKAWYFSGLHAPNYGNFTTYRNISAKEGAIEISNHMIELDMAKPTYEEWTNSTLENVKGRAGAEVVWVPIGKQGILVVLGGVIFPPWMEEDFKSGNVTASKEENPKFMSKIDIYDVATKLWYQQGTENSPPGGRTRGCAVVAPATDGSSFNIYYYGGYDGLDMRNEYYDEVWVLSLPSFKWTLLNKGTPKHGRAAHKCFMPYPDQMMVIGGHTPPTGGAYTCLDKGPVVMFNLSSGNWMDNGYSPTVYSNYSVPAQLKAAVGGNSKRQTKTSSPNGGWSAKALEEIFNTPYDMKKIKSYWPYKPATQAKEDPKPVASGGFPSWVAPVLGVVLGLVLITVLTLVFCLWRRKLVFKNRTEGSESMPTENGLRILSWIKGQPANTKQFAATTSSDFDPSVPDMSKSVSPDRHMSATTISSYPYHEMADTHIVELGDTSTPVELQDTGLTPLEFVSRKTPTPLLQSNSQFQTVGGASMSSAANKRQSQLSNMTDPHVSDSSSSSHRKSLPIRSSVLSNAPSVAPTKTTGPTAHQQQSSISSANNIISPHTERGSDSPTIPISPIIPISPQSTEEQHAEDYLTAGMRVQQRRSIFQEANMTPSR